MSASTVTHTKQIQAIVCGAELWESAGLNLQCNLQCATRALCKWTQVSQLIKSSHSEISRGTSSDQAPENSPNWMQPCTKIHQKSASVAKGWPLDQKHIYIYVHLVVF